MAQNLTLWNGATYSNVPAVQLPKQGGGLATFTDVTDSTAAAADVAQGKYFYTAAGVRTEGTASGGGGGSSKFVMGEFTTSATTGAAATLTISYAGSGYPIAAVFFISGGVYNNTDTGNTTWYNSLQRYAIGEWFMTKSITTSTPTYGTSGTQNQGATTWVYKNSTSQATTYSRSSAMNTNSFTSSNATAAGATAIRFKSRTSVSYFVASTSYGLLASTKYTYIVTYSE